MSEKLYKSHCDVPGHGMKCEVAEDIYPDKRGLAKLRRARDKEIIEIALTELIENQQDLPIEYQELISKYFWELF